MAKQRSRRLRKKMRIDEFQELGFSVKWTFPENTPIEEVDSFVDDFILNVIEPNGLAFDASGYLSWEGLICLQKLAMYRRASSISRKLLKRKKYARCTDL